MSPTDPLDPSNIERLWAPHRADYLDNQAGTFSQENCPFCLESTGQVDDALVIHRGQNAFAVLNKFPCSTGYLLICTNRHVALYDELTADETAEVSDLTKQAMVSLRKVTKAQGFNIGMNQGLVSGAGIAGHLHQHVVPRWPADSNFMPIIGHTKVMPELLVDTRAKLLEVWGK